MEKGKKTRKDRQPGEKENKRVTQTDGTSREPRNRGGAKWAEERMVAPPLRLLTRRLTPTLLTLLRLPLFAPAAVVPSEAVPLLDAPAISESNPVNSKK